MSDKNTPDEPEDFRSMWCRMAKKAIKQKYGSQEAFCEAHGIVPSTLSQALKPGYQNSSKHDQQISDALEIPPPIATNNPQLIRMHLMTFRLYTNRRDAFDGQLAMLEGLVPSDEDAE